MEAPLKLEWKIPGQYKRKILLPEYDFYKLWQALDKDVSDKFNKWPAAPTPDVFWFRHQILLSSRHPLRIFIKLENHLN